MEELAISSEITQYIKIRLGDEFFGIDIKYVDNIVQEWQQVNYSFTLDEKKTVCLIIMNSKSTGTDLLIDDFTITKK